MRAMTDALHGQLYKRASLPKVAPGPYSATFLGARRRHPRPPRNIRALPRPPCRSIRALPRPPCSERSLDHYVEVGRTALMTARLARFGEIWEGKAACGASRRRGSGRGRRPRGTHPAARSSRAAWRAVESSRGRRREVDRLRPRRICFPSCGWHRAAIRPGRVEKPKKLRLAHLRCVLERHLSRPRHAPRYVSSRAEQ